LAGVCLWDGSIFGGFALAAVANVFAYLYALIKAISAPVCLINYSAILAQTGHDPHKTEWS
jgi:hypothetical protein